MANNKNIKINLDYAQFSSGISDCQRKMGLLTSEFKLQQAALGNNASEVERLRVSQDSLTKKIELQQQIVDKASEKFKALSESEGATQSQIDKAQKSLTDQITKLYELGNQVEQVNDRLIELSEAEEESTESADEAGSSQQNLASNITATVAVVASLISAVKQVADAIGDVATKSTEWADDLMTLSSQVGASVETLQTWQYAASFIDVSAETMAGSMSRLTRQMGEVQNGSTSAQAAFNNLGVSVTNADGSLRDAETVFYEVIDALGEIPNKAEQDAAAMAIFGKSAQELAGAIEAGSSGIKAYRTEAEALGIYMSTEEIQSLAQMQNSFDRLGAVMDAAGNKVSASVAPAFASIADAIAELDPRVLALFAGVGSLISVITSLTPLLQAAAAVTQLWTMAKVANTGATLVETAAEVGLAESAMAANAALLPEIAIALAISAAIIGLCYVIEKLIELFEDEADAAEKAADSTLKFKNAATGAESSDSSKSSSSGTKHYALGGRVSGSRVWVGEQGAELVDLPAGSYVHNTTEVNQTTGGNVTNITVNVDHISELQDLLRISQQAQQRNRMGVVTA